MVFSRISTIVMYCKASMDLGYSDWSGFLRTLPILFASTKACFWARKLELILSMKYMINHYGRALDTLFANSIRICCHHSRRHLFRTTAAAQVASIETKRPKQLQKLRRLSFDRLLWQPPLSDYHF